MAIVGTSAGGKSFSFLIKNYYYIIHTFNFLLCFCLGEGRLGWDFCYYGYIRYSYTAVRPAGRWQDMWHKNHRKTIVREVDGSLLVCMCVSTHNTSYHTPT